MAAVGPLVDLSSPVEDSVTPRRGTMLLTEKNIKTFNIYIIIGTIVYGLPMLIMSNTLHRKPWQKWLLYSIKGLVAEVEDTVANG